MVIIDENDASPLKKSMQLPAQTDVGSSVGESTLMSPPAYQATAPIPLPATTPLLREKPPQRAGKRFVKALLAAVAILLLLWILMGSIRDWFNRDHDGPWHPWVPPPFGRPPSEPSHPPLPSPPSGGSVIDCHDFNDGTSGLEVKSSAPVSESSSELLPGKSHSSAYFNFPPDLPLFFVRSRHTASSSGGTIRFQPSLYDADEIAMGVTVGYWSTAARDRVQLCRVKEVNGGEGLVIYVKEPEENDWTQIVDFEINVALPRSSAGRRDLDALETDLANFSQTFTDLESIIAFGNISLKGSNGAVHADSIRANRGTVQTSNGAISGTYLIEDILELVTSNAPIIVERVTARLMTLQTSTGGVKGKLKVSDSLDISASNGQIDVDVDLTNSLARSPAKAKMRTTNGPLRASFNLAAVDEKGQSTDGGAFNIVTSTSNSPLQLTFPEQPLASDVNVTGHTSNGPSGIALHPAFEGSFRLETSNESPAVQRNYRRDPAGKDRHRSIAFNSISRRVVTGSMKYEDRVDQMKHGSGMVEMVTTNGRNELVL